jgi:hypothetical protein
VFSVSTFIYIYIYCIKVIRLPPCLLGRNEIFTMKNRLQNAFGTQILCTISLAVIMRLIMSFPLPFTHLSCQCNADCDIFHKEVSPLTMYMLKVLGALSRCPRALVFRGWSTYRTSTLRRPQLPSSIIPRLPVRLLSTRPSPLPRSFSLVQCMEMKTSSSPICHV